MDIPRTLRRRRAPDLANAAIFLGPALVVILAVTVYPLARSITTGFTDRVFGYQDYSFVGLANFTRMAHDPLFWQAVCNSARLAFFNVGGSLLLGLLLALLLHAGRRYRAVFRCLLFLPWVLPSMVISLMFRWLYNDMYGWANYILLKHGLISSPTHLLAAGDTAWTGILVPIVWCYYPFVMLVLLAALQSINPAYYEAAAIDGASRWHSFRYITMPLLRPVIAVVIILETIWSLTSFDLVYLLTGGGPANATLTLSLYIYKQGFVSKWLGYSSALATVMFLALLALTLAYFWVINRSQIYED
ncbi:MAG: sugar ABC transporter permease [Syntrophomonadaceae bacterium]|jgi:multiple sugar transport system permease protein|nr:sugar ABC transporter permease [Syntrophomonadaceae bacterium]